MLYGDEKSLEMARSILPSTRSKQARAQKRMVNKRERAVARHALRHVDPVDYEVDQRYPLGWQDKRHRDYLIWERRAADKLSHFETWAEQVTADMPKQDRLSYIKKILPDGLIGQHAVSHIDWKDHFCEDFFAHAWRRRSKSDTPAERSHRETLWDVCAEAGGQKLFNRYLKQQHKVIVWSYYLPAPPIKLDPDCTVRRIRMENTGKVYYQVDRKVGPMRPRLLYGLGDIDAFLADVTKASMCSYRVEVEPYMQPSHVLNMESMSTSRWNPDHHGEWWRATQYFCKAWEQAKGDVRAVQSAL